MARPLTYTPVREQDDPAAAQVDDFVAALDESGLLRALTGAIRAYPDIAALLVERVDADVVRSLVALGGLAKGLDPGGTERFVGAARDAVGAADEALTAREAPSLLGIVKQLGDADVRRGAGALLSALGALGRGMAKR